MPLPTFITITNVRTSSEEIAMSLHARAQGRTVTFNSSHVQVRNGDTSFHNVSLMAQRTERGVVTGHTAFNFEVKPPGSTVEKEAALGTSTANWAITAANIDGQWHQINRSLDLRPSGRGGGFLRRLIPFQPA